MLHLSILLKRLLLLLGVYQLCRMAFLLANAGYFETAAPGDIFGAFIAGFRFDISVILMINIPFALFHLFPVRLFYSYKWQLFLKYLFFIGNLPFLLLNCVDLEYFKYQGKRTTADLFQLFGMGDDMKNTLPQMIIDFWYVVAIFLMLSFLLYLGYSRIKLQKPEPETRFRLISWLLIIPVFGLLFVGARGGLQLKPLGIMAAAKMVSPKMIPLALNTPFTVIRTFGKSLIEEKSYMSEEELSGWFSKDHFPPENAGFRPLNVVIILLESFSSEYIGELNNGDGYTPHLDSLMRLGANFTNAFANAKKSIDGIPAVVASMPTLMPASYISSPYNSNELLSVAGILKSKDYASGFFHGGNNGTMNFDNFTLITGFEKYYGRKEYPGDDYDGHWGVFDEPFYMYFIEKCNQMRKPFVNVFFSLSSHHPYSIPSHLAGRFPKGSLPIHESIGYADYALGKFFEKASQTEWYHNTLFVITADHTGPSGSMKYNSKAGHFMIPLLFYHPGSHLKGSFDRVTQQTDIIPGILDYLRYDEPFTSFGNSPFDTLTMPFAVNYPGDVYQVIGDKYLVQFDGNETVAAFEYKTDTLLMRNVASPENQEQTKLVMTLKSVLQQYNSSLIRNELQPGHSRK